MPNVKIELQKGESEEQATELLFKALLSQRDGSLHEDGKFHDPAMEHMAQRLVLLHQDEYQKMLQEIFEELDKEYQNHGDI
jgi:hypothetical protein